MKVDRLMRLPLFGELDHHDLSHIAARVNEVELAAGDVLIEQGSMPYDVFVLEEGTVEVVRDGQQVATLGAGEVVGEMGLIDLTRRTATVRATSPVRAVVLQVADLEAMEEDTPEVVAQLRAIAAKRRRELDEENGA